MKIGVVTFWWGNDNYGQIAQCFALQTVLKELGHEPFVVRCHWKDSWKGKVMRIVRFFKPSVRERRKNWNTFVKPELRRFRNFLETHCTLGEDEFHAFETLKRKCPEADCFIVGSDQVWNCNPDANGRVWFLDFVPADKKKVAYAASFGKLRTSSAFKAFCREKLAAFDAVGVREKEGEEFLKALGVSSKCVADPTLLLSRETYETIAGAQKFSPIPYVFCYWLGRHNPNDVLPAGEVSDFLVKENLPLKSVVAGVPFPASGLGEIESLTLPQWFAAIRDAEVVFTNSFHGTVFCLIFRKPVVVFPALTESGNGRLRSLLSLCGLENRIYDREKNSVEKILSQPVDWSAVENRLTAHCRESENFLKQALA